jgi:hypothetical protein
MMARIVVGLAVANDLYLVLLPLRLSSQKNLRLCVAHTSLRRLGRSVDD